MNSTLPDIAGMLILMGVLYWLRRKHHDSSVDLWMLGLTFILVEAVAVAVLRGSPRLSLAAHALALDAYLLAAVTFGWAAREDLLPGSSALPLFLPPAIPLLALTTLYGFNLQAGQAYLAIAAASLLLGLLYIAFFVRSGWGFRLRLLAIHGVLWGPMVWMAMTAQLRLLVYWGLACLYLLVAPAFRKRVHRAGVGGLVIVSGFVVWALCFLAHPFVRALPAYNTLVDQTWTMQKFFVIIGMLLVLLEEQTGRLKQEAMHDPLTGLPNRRLFNDRLIQAMERARRTGRSSAVFVVDLNNFKLINDTYGHRTGDLVLTRSAHILRSKIRGSDTLARCGGDEFSIIVNDLARASDCERIADTLRAAVASVDLPANPPLPISASIGFALFPDDVTDATELCELADVRMYKDKRMRGLSNSGMIPILRNV